MKAEQIMDRVFIPTMGAVAAEPAVPLTGVSTPVEDPLDDSIEVEVREAPSGLHAGVPVGVASSAAAAPATMPQAIPSGTGFAGESVQAEPFPSRHGPGSASADAAPADTAAPPAQRPGAGVWRRSPWGRMSWQPRRPAFSSAWLSQPWQIAGVSVSPRLALAFSGGVACLALGTSATLWFGWNQANSDLRQERTIRLLEGIRELGPRDESTASRGPTAPEKDSKDNPSQSADGLPPPPPDEPWIEELGQLDGQRNASPARGAAPLRVPVNGTLRAPAPVASAPASLPVAPPPPVPAAAAAPSPELVGVVQIPGRPGSAIFQVGGSSTNASAGESIGSSGWRLVTTSGDSAVIERGGVSRRVSISSGF